MKEICFVIPQMKDGWLKVEFSSREALGLQYICADLEKHNIKYNFINAHAYRIDDEDVCKTIIENNYKIVAVSCISQRSYPNVKTFITLLRDKYNYRGILYMGGFFATLSYKEILFDTVGYVDFIQRGEGEIITPKIIEKIFEGKDIESIEGIVFYKNGKINGNLDTHYIENLDILEYPIRDANLLGNVAGEDRNFKIVAGRGCYNNCTFCSIIIDGRPRKKRFRSPNNVIGEIEMILKKYPVNHFRFCDEIFYTNTKYGKKWVKDFVDLIEEKKLEFTFHIEMRAVDVTEEELIKLKNVGLKTVSIGFESGVQRILNEMKKNCKVSDNIRAAEILKKIKIEHNVSFITIIPTMSFEELKENYLFLKTIGGYTAHNLYNKLNLYLGCEYEQILEEKGLLLAKNSFYERSNFRYCDERVQFYADIIDEMKLIVLKCRKFVLFVTNNNNSTEIVHYFNKKFDFFILNFVEYCMGKLEFFSLEEPEYIKFIEIRVDEILNELEQFCIEKKYVYTRDLKKIAEDHIFV